MSGRQIRIGLGASAPLRRALPGSAGGYLDYIGEKEAFTVEVLQDEENGKVAVLGVIPNGSKVWRFVGPNHWEDGPTIEGCIASAIHEMARSAHKTY